MRPGQPVKEAPLRHSNGASSKIRAEQQEQEALVDGKFLEIHRSKLELDPGSNGGQPSIRCITHGVFFFRVRKDALNGLGAQGVGCFAKRRMPDVFRPFQVILPDVARNCFGTLSAQGAAFTDRAALADVTLEAPPLSVKAYGSAGHYRICGCSATSLVGNLAVYCNHPS